MEHVGLVLEGGGMRGVYTAGVLEAFLKNDMIFPYVIGVSAGACNAASYLSRQAGRNKKVNIDFARHPKYISYKNLFLKGELFGMDFIFDEIPNQHVPFDYDTLDNAEERYVIGVTDCVTGQPVYFEKKNYPQDVLQLLRASSSLPYMAPVVDFYGQALMDGGISDPIPVKKAEADGYVKNVVVLTRNKGYRKKPGKWSFLLTRTYRKYPELTKAMMARYRIYNETLDYLEAQEKAGKVFIIRPEEKLEVGRVERNPEKLLDLYNQGYQDTESLIPKLELWMNRNKVTSRL